MAPQMVCAIRANEEHIRQWLSWPRPEYGLLDALAFIASQREQWARDNLESVGLWRDDALLGAVTLNSFVRENRSVAIGYWLCRSEQGKGLITRACRAMVDDLFCARGLHRVVINVHPENVASRRIPERLGFREEGILRGFVRHQDGFGDWVVYAMLEHEWSSERA